MLPNVRIALATCNGEAHLPGQLASISQQKNVNWRLDVSDDGSVDATVDVLRRFGERYGDRLRLVAGPKNGAAMNFLSLIDGHDGDDTFLALSDQDDIWCPDRLEHAVGCLGPANSQQPRIYASRTWLIEKDGTAPRPSRRHRRQPGFQNALLQNVLAGNTIVMNPAAARIAGRVRFPRTGVPFHDWWLYLILSGAGAQIILDDRPTLFYRQHRGNLLGAHSGASASFSRILAVLRSEYSRWIRANIAALDLNRSLLTDKSQAQMDEFSNALDRTGPARARAIIRSGAYRQTRVGGLCVLGAAAIGRV